jgi:hypothetical protein
MGHDQMPARKCERGGMQIFTVIPFPKESDRRELRREPDDVEPFQIVSVE